MPHMTLKTIANDEPPAEEVLVDRPEMHQGHRAGDGPVRVRGDDPGR